MLLKGSIGFGRYANFANNCGLFEGSAQQVFVFQITVLI